VDFGKLMKIYFSVSGYVLCTFRNFLLNGRADESLIILRLLVINVGLWKEKSLDLRPMWLKSLWKF